MGIKNPNSTATYFIYNKLNLTDNHLIMTFCSIKFLIRMISNTAWILIGKYLIDFINIIKGIPLGRIKKTINFVH